MTRGLVTPILYDRYGIMDDAGGRTMTCGIIDGTGIEDGTHHRRQEVGISARKLARQESICIWGVPLGSEGILKLSSTCTQRPTCLLRLAQYIAAPLVHHTRPAAVPLGANPPVALLLQDLFIDFYGAFFQEDAADRYLPFPSCFLLDRARCRRSPASNTSRRSVGRAREGGSSKGKDGTARIRGDRKNFSPTAHHKIRIPLGNFQSISPGHKKTVSLDLEDLRIFLPKKIKYLTAFRCQQMFRETYRAYGGGTGQLKLSAIEASAQYPEATYLQFIIYNNSLLCFAFPAMCWCPRSTSRGIRTDLHPDNGRPEWWWERNPRSQAYDMTVSLPLLFPNPRIGPSLRMEGVR